MYFNHKSHTEWEAGNHLSMTALSGCMFISFSSSILCSSPGFNYSSTHSRQCTFTRSSFRLYVLTAKTWILRFIILWSLDKMKVSINLKILSWFWGVWLQKGYGLDEGIYWHLANTTWNYTDQWHTQTDVLSLLQSPLAISWKLREILQLPMLRSSCHTCLCRTPVN
jgi:hypothetical protein